MKNPYADIISLPRPVSRHPPMSRANRAAQFAPFAALTGHEEAIHETATRVMQEQVEITTVFEPDTSSHQESGAVRHGSMRLPIPRTHC